MASRLHPGALNLKIVRKDSRALACGGPANSLFQSRLPLVAESAAICVRTPSTEPVTSNSPCFGQRNVLPSKTPGSISSASDLQIGHVAIVLIFW